MEDTDQERVDRIDRAARKQGLLLTGRVPDEADSDGYALVDGLETWASGTLDDVEEYLLQLPQGSMNDDEPILPNIDGQLSKQVHSDRSPTGVPGLRDV